MNGAGKAPKASKTGRLDPRASRGGLKPLSTRAGLPGSAAKPFARAAYFAADLLARHGVQFLRLPALEQRFWPMARSIHIDRRRTQNMLSTRLELHAYPQFFAAQAAEIQPVSAAQMRWASATVSPSERHSLRVERFVEAITRRILRVVNSETSEPGSPERQEQKTQVGRLPKPAVMVYPPRQSMEAAGEPRQAGQSHSEINPVTQPAVRAAQTTPPVDVRGLADRVLQVLDQRLIAGRERMGRSG